MFPIEIKDLIKNQILIKKKRLLIFSTGFEERSLTVFNILKRSVFEFEYFNFGVNSKNNRFEKECAELRDKNINYIKKGGEITPIIEIFESNSKPIDKIIDLIEPKISEEIKTIIVDISTMPKIIYFPLINWLIQEFNSKDLLLCYTNPGKYGDVNLESEALNPELLVSFPKEYQKKKKWIWIPCLGFKSDFTKKVWRFIEGINYRHKIEKDIFPLISFPAYRPDYFDKTLLQHLECFKDELNQVRRMQKNIVYVSQYDPFDSYYAIEKIFNNNPDSQLVLTPLGPKPVSIGMLMASIDFKIPVYILRAVTYHFNYSIGSSTSFIYYLKQDGVKMY